MTNYDWYLFGFAAGRGLSFNEGQIPNSTAGRVALVLGVDAGSNKNAPVLNKQDVDTLVAAYIR